MVSNIQGYAIDSVPEHALAMMLALRRNLKGYHRDIGTHESLAAAEADIAGGALAA